MFYFMRQSLKFGKEARAAEGKKSENRVEGGQERLVVGIMTGIRRHKKTTLIKVAFCFFSKSYFLDLDFEEEVFLLEEAVFLEEEEVLQQDFAALEP